MLEHERQLLVRVENVVEPNDVLVLELLEQADFTQCARRNTLKDKMESWELILWDICGGGMEV